MIDADRALEGPPEVQLFRLVLALGMRLRTLMDQRLAAIGLTTQQAALLTIVGAATEPPTLGVLAHLLGCSHQNVRQLVGALARKGLVELVPDPSDRRARRVHATGDWEALFGPRDEEDRAAVRGWFAGLSDDEVRAAVQLLRRASTKLP